jgi:hypothetical protein
LASTPKLLHPARQEIEALLGVDLEALQGAALCVDRLGDRKSVVFGRLPPPGWAPANRLNPATQAR